MWLNELYHHLNPIIVQIGPLAIRWYGLAYVVGLALAAVVIYRVARRWNLGLTSDDVTSVIIAIAFGLIIGARLFYVVFYGDGYYLQHPLKVFATYEGGMSFHGGLVGAIVGGSLACRKLRISIPTMCDLAVIGAPVGLFFGRCANFINGACRGASCLTTPEAAWCTAIRRSCTRPCSRASSCSSFCLRFRARQTRRARRARSWEPSFTNWLTMGQCLSIPLVVAGIVILVLSHRAQRPQLGKLAAAGEAAA